MRLDFSGQKIQGGISADGYSCADSALAVRLRLHQRRDEEIEIAWIDVADGKNAEISGGCRIHGETGMGAR